MIMPPKVTDFDREIWADELEDFVPEKVFDAHCHLWDEKLAGRNEDINSALRLNIDYRKLYDLSAEIFPDRELGFLLLPTPLAKMDTVKCNIFMGEQAALSPHHTASAIATPDMTAEYLAETVKKHNLCGLKVYRSFADDPANCRIADYLPESLIEVADDNSLCITMHMSRFDGIADKENLADLKYFTAKYKNVRWILAHCARAFNSYTLEKNIFILRDMPNLNYDLSAVCDCRSHYLLFKHENLSRIMFGTDNIDAGGVHAKYITWGKGWQYFTGMDVPHCRKEATYVCYEGLRSIKQAADMAGLNRKDIEDIFFNNAMRFFSISDEKVCSN